MGELHCPYCGASISPDFLFCPSCGSKLDSVREFVEQAPSQGDSQKAQTTKILICPTCGYHNDVTAKACESCGSSLKNVVPVSIPVSATAPESQAVPRSSVRGSLKEKQTSKRRDAVRSAHPDYDRKKITTGKFKLETYQIVAIVAAIFLGGLVIYGIVSSRGQSNQAETGGQVQSGNKPSANVMQEIDRLRQVVDKNPSDLSSTLKLANMLQDNQFFDQAAVYYKRYLDKNPNDADARIDYGVTLFEGGNVDGGVGEIKAALKLDPNHQIGYYNLGIIYLNQGKFDEANNEFKKCVSIDPNSDIGKRAKQILEQHANLNKTQEVK
ncbi:MAG: tetratricopeptide repeat protein [Candidatus Kryptoniota bacterium]